MYLGTQWASLMGYGGIIAFKYESGVLTGIGSVQLWVS
jgi:hypothetical protein